MSKEPSWRAQRFVELLKSRVDRQGALSLLSCVHCGLCNDSCHYVITHPEDTSFVPAVKADILRRIFKRHIDWTGRLWRLFGARDIIINDQDLKELSDIVFGKCTNCRRCSVTCPMGVDFATVNRMARGILVAVGIMPEGVEVVSKDQWEVGNQMGVLDEEYIDTLEWQSEELADTLEDPTATIPVDKVGCEFVYAINPREIKYDPRSIHDAAKIFHMAGADWTMSSEGWDMTNFGLFSGDDALGGTVARRVYDSVHRLEARKLVMSECGHGYRSTGCEGPNWAGVDVTFPMESVVVMMQRYLDEGILHVDPSKNPGAYTYHDSCNLARSCGFFEEPRRLLTSLVTDFREMYPNRQENYCCTGGGGAMSMSEYTGTRLASARLKAEQLKATGADYVVTSCHNCVDGLTDVIKHYKLDMKVVQLIHLFARAASVPESVERRLPLHDKKILIIDDDPDTVEYIEAVLADHGAVTTTATTGDSGIDMARAILPDLVTLDLSMPGRDGADVFYELRKDPALSSLKICIITGRPELRHLIYNQKTRRPDGYMNKPVNDATLIQNTRKILGC